MEIVDKKRVMQDAIVLEKRPHFFEERPQSLGEEIANSISHGVGLVAALVGTPILILSAARRGEATVIVSASIFAATVLILYLTSTLYHALARNRAKLTFRVLDRSAIFLLIAGTYTPFTLGTMPAPWGWVLFGVIWGLALVGIVLETTGLARCQWVSTGLYLMMGWLVLVAARPFLNSVPLPGLLWLLAGGIAYTVGVAFFSSDERVRYGHFVWHLFVLAGTSCHFIAVLWYAT